MKHKWFFLVSMLAVFALLASACAPQAATEAPGAAPTEVMTEAPAITEAPAVTEEPAATEAPAATEVLPETGATEIPEESGAAGCPLEVEEGATITFSGWGDETEQQIYRDSIARFQSICQGVTVNYEPIPADFQTKLKAQMAGGTAPDVFYVDDQLMTAFAPTGQLLVLNPYLEQAGVSADDFIPALMTMFTQDGQIYALPKDWGTLGLVYLPAAFEAAGIPEPTEDWTWDDLRTAAQAIAETGQYAGFCQSADASRLGAWVLSNGGSFTNEDFTQATLDTPEVKEMAEMILAMKEEGSLVSATDVGASWCGEAIGKELVGMTLEGGWMVNFMRQNYPDVEWNAVLIPSGPVTRADLIFTNGLGVNAATEFPNAAAAFVMYVTGTENQAEIVSTGFAYSTHPDQADLVQNPQDQAISQGGLLPDSRADYYGPNSGTVKSIISQALERIYLGDQSVDEAFAQAQEEVQAALDSAQ